MQRNWLRMEHRDARISKVWEKWRNNAKLIHQTFVQIRMSISRMDLLHIRKANQSQTTQRNSRFFCQKFQFDSHCIATVGSFYFHQFVFQKWSNCVGRFCWGANLNGKWSGAFWAWHEIRQTSCLWRWKQLESTYKFNRKIPFDTYFSM